MGIALATTIPDQVSGREISGTIIFEFCPKMSGKMRTFNVTTSSTIELSPEEELEILMRRVAELRSIIGW